MIFKNPQILWALFAIAIPIIIHLFNFKRYKKVYFSNIAMLKNVELQTKKYSQIKHLLVLLSRILFIASMVFAFAQPYIPAQNNLEKNSSKTVVSVFIDNSFTMQNETEKSNALEQAVSIANNIAESYNQYDDFILITNDLESKYSQLISKNNFISEINQIDFSSKSIDFEDILNFQNSIIEDEFNVETYLISDFQKSQFDLNILENTENQKTHLIPISSVEQKNIYIDSIWVDAPFIYKNKAFKVYYRINNFSTSNVEELSVNLHIDGEIRGISTVNIDAMSEAVSFIDLKFNDAGNKNAYLSFSEFPVDYDNTFYFNVEVYDNISILEISKQSEKSIIEKFYETDSSFTFEKQNSKNIDYSSLSKYNVIIINQLDEFSGGLNSSISNFIKEGGSLLFIPEIKEENIAEINNLLQKLKIPPITESDSNQVYVNYINANSLEFNDVFEANQDLNENILDFPIVKKYFRQAKLSSDNGETLLGLSNSEAFLKSYKLENGKFYLLFSSLQIEDNNLREHALIVPTLFNIAIQSRKSGKLYHSTNDNKISFAFNKSDAESVFKVENLKTKAEFIPQFQFNFRNVIMDFKNNINEDGFYLVKTNSDSIVHNFSMNYPRTESELEYYSFSELKDFASNHNSIELFDGNASTLNAKITSMNTDKDLWIIFIFLGLLFILFEVILLRFLK